MCNAYNHPPGCTCGWGGEGHLGRSYGGGTVTPTHPRSSWAGITREWREREFTRPTKCPECGKEVYFVRHNGGSVWIDPPLGPPWDRHACFDKPLETPSRFSRLTLKSAGLTNPKLGVIRRIDGVGALSEPTIHIQLTDSTTVSLVLRWTPSDLAMVGSLVILSEEDSLLIHPAYAEIPFHTFSRVTKTDSLGWYACPRCKAWVQHRTGHEDYCRTHYTARLTERPQLPAGTPANVKTRVHNGTKQKANTYRPSTGGAFGAAQRSTIDHPHPQLVAAAKAHDSKIEDSVKRIAKQAWEVSMDLAPDARLKAAKHHALRLIAGLSPSIRRQVEHRFTSTKWGPLMLYSPELKNPLDEAPLSWALPSPPKGLNSPEPHA